MLRDRNGLHHRQHHSNRDTTDKAVIRRYVLGLAGVSALAAAISATFAYVTLGTQEVARVLPAFAICLAPAMVAMAIVASLRNAPPTTRLLAIAAATPIRFLATLFLAILAQCVILSPKDASFWIWIVVAYALTLAAEVRLMLRVLRQPDSGGANGQSVAQNEPS